MGRLDALYARLPLLLQHAAVSAFGAYWYWQRFGPGYRRYVAEYTARDHWSAAEWNAWQRRRLRAVLAGAAREVPYYRDTWTTAECRAALAGHLTALPLLGKEPLRADPQAFVWPRRAPRRPLIFHTSGSTGTPIASYWSLAELRRSLAVREVRSAGWAGVSFRDPRATFSGRMVEPDPLSAGPFYRYNAVERQTYLSPFHLRPATARQYVAALQRGQRFSLLLSLRHRIFDRHTRVEHGGKVRDHDLAELLEIVDEIADDIKRGDIRNAIVARLQPRQLVQVFLVRGGRLGEDHILATFNHAPVVVGLVHIGHEFERRILDA